MRVSKTLLRDCLQFQDQKNLTSIVTVSCSLDCERCGFSVRVAEERRQRIRAGDWSYRFDSKGQKIAYLYIGQKEDVNAE